MSYRGRVENLGQVFSVGYVLIDGAHDLACFLEDPIPRPVRVELPQPLSDAVVLASEHVMESAQS